MDAYLPISLVSPAEIFLGTFAAFWGGQLLHDKTSCIFNKLEVFKVIFVENVILDDSASGQNTFLIIVWKFKEILRK